MHYFIFIAGFIMEMAREFIIQKFSFELNELFQLHLTQRINVIGQFLRRSEKPRTFISQARAGHHPDNLAVHAVGFFGAEKIFSIQFIQFFPAAPDGNCWLLSEINGAIPFFQKSIQLPDARIVTIQIDVDEITVLAVVKQSSSLISVVYRRIYLAGGGVLRFQQVH